MKLIHTFFLCLIFSLLYLPKGQSQYFVESAQDGFIIKKLVSNTTIQSGVTFSYTIFYSLPAGANNITITDNVPAGLVIDGVVAGPVCGTPTVNVVGNTVTYQLTGVVAACSGSFQINVRFPAGVTCDGERALNRVCIQADGLENLCTERLEVEATAKNPFVVNKNVVAGINPDWPTDPCRNIAAVGDTLCYNIWVTKGGGCSGDTIGQMNLNNAIVTDVLPAGAMLVSSTCGATQSGSTITWTVGNMNAALPYTSAYCQFKVYYPAGTFPAGTQVNNTALLNGDACNMPVDTFSQTTCVLISEPLDSATFAKQLYMNNFVPGCTGRYRLTICNRGNTNQTFSVSDILPTNITVNQIQVSTSGVNGAHNSSANSGAVSITTGATGSNNYNVPGGTTITDYEFMQTGLLPGNCTYIWINFTLDSGVAPGTMIENCATFNSTSVGTITDCVKFTVENSEPDLCLRKIVCDDDNTYQVGDTVRYRIRVQNIGSATLTGANLNDLLDPNLSYLGNELYYEGSSWTTPCSPDGTTIPSGATAWTGVTTAHSGNDLTWTLPDIASDCQAFYWANCGIYGVGALPFYFIEFDAVVNNDAAAGVVPNSFTAQGGNLPGTENSNTANIVINAIYGMELFKQVSIDNGATWSDTTVMTPAGSTAMYRLGFKNTSNLSVSEIKLIDLLPRDDAPDDWLVLNRAVPRGSDFDLTYGGGLAVSSTQGPVPAPTVGFSAGNNICLPVVGYSPGGCNPSAAWPWPASPTTRNVGFDFTTFALNQSETLYADFLVTTPSGAAVDEKACNDFAATSVGNFILDGTTTMVPLTANAAAPICLKVGEPINETCCDKIEIQKDQDNPCCFFFRSECRVSSFTISVTGGTITGATWNAPDPIGTAFLGQTSHTFNLANPFNIQMQPCFVADGMGPMMVTIDFVFPDGETCQKEIDLEGCKDCCPDFISKSDSTECRFELAQEQNDCEDADIKKIEINLINGTFGSPIDVPCAPGSFAPGSYVGTSAVTMTGIPCAVSDFNFVIFDAEAIDCQEYVVMEMLIHLGDGRVCMVTDSIMCPCPPAPTDCCPIIEDEYTTCEPSIDLIHGTYSIQNLNASGICYIEISSAPAGTFLQGSLSIDGSPSAIPWTTSRIPSMGDLMPPAMTDLEFTLYGVYSGDIMITVFQCDGTECMYTFPWNADEGDEPVIVDGETPITDKLLATGVRLEASAEMKRAVKYIAVGMMEEENNDSEFFAISGAVHSADSLPSYLEPVASAKMGARNAFFELKQAKLFGANETSGQFNMVFKNTVPKLRYTLFDEDGNVISKKEVNGLLENEVTTSLVQIDPDKEGLIQNITLAPNPADASTSLQYQLQNQKELRIELVDVEGRFIQLIQDQRMGAGSHEVQLLTNKLSPGNYLLRFMADGVLETMQLVIVR